MKVLALTARMGISSSDKVIIEEEEGSPEDFWRGEEESCEIRNLIEYHFGKNIQILIKANDVTKNKDKLLKEDASELLLKGERRKE